MPEDTKELKNYNKSSARHLYSMNIPILTISKLLTKDRSTITSWKEEAKGTELDWDEAKATYQQWLSDEMTKGFISTKMKMYNRITAMADGLFKKVNIDKINDTTALKLYLEYMKFLYSLTGGADTIVNINPTEDPNVFFNKFWGIDKNSTKTQQ